MMSSMNSMSKTKQALGLGGWFFVSFAASVVGGLASIRAQAFYSALDQPAWAPPPWLFGPVWSVLYVMIAVAAWLVWRQGGLRANALALGVFLAQLALNALWTWLFFAWRLGAVAFLEIILLWVLIAATVVAFWKVRPLAGALMTPYLAWVTFAGVLNYSLWRLNPQILG